MGRGGSGAVEALNQKHSVIGNYGSKCVVLSWERWNIDPKVFVPTFQTFEDFAKRYMNRYVLRETDEGTKRVAAGKYWLGDPKRTTYEGVVFEPGEPVLMSGNRLNLWRGFAVEPKAGCWSRQRDHLYEVIADGDPRAGQYIERWIAWMFQNPGVPAEVALALRGLEGAGKGLLARALCGFSVIADCRSPIRSTSSAHSAGICNTACSCSGRGVLGGRRERRRPTEGALDREDNHDRAEVRPALPSAQPAPRLDRIEQRLGRTSGSGRTTLCGVRRERTPVAGLRVLREARGWQDNGGAGNALRPLRLPLAGWHPKQIYETAALTDQKQRSLRGSMQQSTDGCKRAFFRTIRAFGSLTPTATSDDLLRAVREFDRHTNKEQIAGELRNSSTSRPATPTATGVGYSHRSTSVGKSGNASTVDAGAGTTTREIG